MDDSQSPGDNAHTNTLNDVQLLFTPLGNYLYRSVSVLRLLFRHVSSSLWYRYHVEVKPQFLQPTDAETFLESKRI